MSKLDIAVTYLNVPCGDVVTVELYISTAGRHDPAGIDPKGIGSDHHFRIQ